MNFAKFIPYSVICYLATCRIRPHWKAYFKTRAKFKLSSLTVDKPQKIPILKIAKQEGKMKKIRIKGKVHEVPKGVEAAIMAVAANGPAAISDFASPRSGGWVNNPVASCRDLKSASAGALEIVWDSEMVSGDHARRRADRPRGQKWVRETSTRRLRAVARKLGALPSLWGG